VIVFFIAKHPHTFAKETPESMLTPPILIYCRAVAEFSLFNAKNQMLWVAYFVI